MSTTPTITASTTRDEDFWFCAGALGAAGVVGATGAGTLIAESTETTDAAGVAELDVLRDGTAGITMRVATFLAGAFFATFFATFLAGAFFVTFLATAFFATAFFAGAFLAADFLAVFLTATGDSSVKSDRISERDRSN